MEKFRYLKKEKLSQLPRAPGVYALASPKAILYIGKAGNLRERIKNHFHQANWRDNLFINQVSRVGYVKTNSDVEALILESQLIKAKQPKYNVMWKDDKKYFFVAITKEKLTRVFLTHQPILSQAKARLSLAKDAAEYIGPFVEGKAIKRVLRMLRRVFPYYTVKKHGPLSCSWCHLNLCPGPHPDQKQYKKNLANLAAVLKGKKSSVVKRVKKEMGQAAKSQDFEKAGVLRDQLLSLERIVSHARLGSPEVPSEPAWPVIEKELQKLFGTSKRIVRVEAYDISNIQGKEATGSQVTFLKGAPAKEHYRKYKIHIAGRANDYAMLQELITRRLQHQEWPYPQLMVIDGGKGQLTSALKAIANAVSLSYPHLKETTFKRIKVAALAKKQNELFFPGRQKAVLLRDLPRPLENLFLHIRDEAHRFAISYHRHLRSKSVIGNKVH